jgi:hypothetical protein
MKKFREIVLAFSFMAGACLAVHAAGVTDLEDLCTGPNESNCPWKVSSSGGLTMGSNILQGGPTVVTSGISSLNTAANTSIAVPVLVSTAVSQGMVIVATTTNQTGLVNGVISYASGQTTNLGIADTAASSGTVVNVDYAGVSLGLTTGTIVVGDLLVSTITWPGYLVTNNSAAAGAIIATALTAENSTTSGLTRVLIHH